MNILFVYYVVWFDTLIEKIRLYIMLETCGYVIDRLSVLTSTQQRVLYTYGVYPSNKVSPVINPD